MLALPLRHFLDSLAALFPALPAPLLDLLASLSAGPAAAVAATNYLAAIPALSSLHELPDAGIAADPSAGPAGVVTAGELPLPGSKALTLPEGVGGEVLVVPAGALAPEAPRVWAFDPGAQQDGLVLVRGRRPLAHGDALALLLCRSFEALAAARGGGGQVAAAALHELHAALGFFAAVCRGDPATAADLLHIQVPAAEGLGQRGNDRAPDLLGLASQGAAALIQAHPVPSATLAHCFAVCAALAPSCPGRVLEELLGVLGVTPLALSLAAAASPAVGEMLQDVPPLRRLLLEEAAAGGYQATQALLQLLAALLQAGCPSPALAALVSFVVQRVAPELTHRRFAQRAQRWKLATACLNVVRHALLAAPSLPSGQRPAGVVADGSEEESSAPARAVAAVLRFDAGAASCLFPLLPPDAAKLEVGAVCTLVESVF